MYCEDIDHSLAEKFAYLKKISLPRVNAVAQLYIISVSHDAEFSFYLKLHVNFQGKTPQLFILVKFIMDSLLKYEYENLIVTKQMNECIMTNMNVLVAFSFL